MCDDLLDDFLYNCNYLRLDETLLRNQTFRADLKTIAKLLDESKSANIAVYVKRESFAFFQKIFACLLDHLMHTYGSETSEEALFEVLHHLFSIVRHVVYQQGGIYHNVEHFLQAGLIQVMLDLFADAGAIRFLFEGYLTILAKTVSLC